MKNAISLDQYLQHPKFILTILKSEGSFKASLLFERKILLTREGDCSSRAYDKLSLGIVLDRKKVQEKLQEIEEGK